MILRKSGLPNLQSWSRHWVNKGIRADQSLPIGITNNERQTNCFGIGRTGKTLYNAIRSARCDGQLLFGDSLKSKGHAEHHRFPDWVIIDAYFSATKSRWILGNVEGARARAEAGGIGFLVRDGWLVLENLQLEKTNLTDITNCQPNMLFKYSYPGMGSGIIGSFCIPASMLLRWNLGSEKSLIGETTGDVLQSKIPNRQNSGWSAGCTFWPNLCNWTRNGKPHLQEPAAF